MALRWGLTKGNYDKWVEHFYKKLPITIKVSNSLSQASYLRDAIIFAYENDLPGREWYNKVKVSPIDKHTLVVTAKEEFSAELGEDRYPESTVFELMLLAEEGKLYEGYRTKIVDSPEAVVEALDALGWDVVPIYSNIVELRAKKKEESNGLQ